MDVLQTEIDIVKHDLAKISLLSGVNRLEFKGVWLEGQEVNDVLALVRDLKERRLAHLIGLKTEGAHS